MYARGRDQSMTVVRTFIVPAVSTLVPFFHSKIIGPKFFVLHGSNNVWPISVRNTCPSVRILAPEPNFPTPFDVDAEMDGDDRSEEDRGRGSEYS